MKTTGVYSGLNSFPCQAEANGITQEELSGSPYAARGRTDVRPKRAFIT